MSERFSFNSGRNNAEKLSDEWVEDGAGIVKKKSAERELPEPTFELHEVSDGVFLRKNIGEVTVTLESPDVIPEEIKPVVEASKKLFNSLGISAQQLMQMSEQAAEYIIEQSIARSAGVREAIAKRMLTSEQRKALANTILNVAPAALAAASPTLDVAPEADASSEYEQVDYTVSEPELLSAEEIREANRLVIEAEEFGSSQEFGNRLAEKIEWVNGLDEHMQAMRTNAELPAAEGSDTSRIDYLIQNISFSDNVPEEAQDIFRAVIAGLCGQESGFRLDAVSATGARGPLQFQPETWTDLGGDINDIENFEKQVEMAGRFFSILYDRVEYHVTHEYDGNGGFDRDVSGERALRQIEEAMDASEYAKFRAYSAIVSYNTGDRRWGTAIKRYVSAYGVNEGVSAGDLFIQISDFAFQSNDGVLSGFGEDGHSYVFKTTATSLVLQGGENVRATVAYNDF